MSAAELIQRFGIEGCTGDFIEADVQTAIRYVIWASENRIKLILNESTGSVYLDACNVANVERNMNMAHSYGWPISRVIADIVEKEEAEVKAQVSDEMWGWYMTACATDTCEKCDRPFWHHIEGIQGPILCPNGRRFWQIARVLWRNESYCPWADDDDVVREIARRA